MKNLSAKQIAQVRKIESWHKTQFHGNTKMVGSLPIEVYLSIISLKKNREIAKQDNCIETPAQKVRRLITWSKKCQNTNYFKVLIEGEKNIYYAHPEYQHMDYNKSRCFEKNANNLNLMRIFNAIVYR